MPQTREHVAIAELLGVPRAVVALTKTDLVDPEWLELARDDVVALPRGDPLRRRARGPHVRRRGAGWTSSRAAIRSLPGARGQGDDLFRMPVDRVFTVRGTGTVVTGTVWSGARPGIRQVRILPADHRPGTGPPGARRGRAAVEPGQRAAIALAGVDRDQAPRGSTLVTDAVWTAARSVTLRLRVLPGSRMEHRARPADPRAPGHRRDHGPRLPVDGTVIEAGREAGPSSGSSRPSSPGVATGS
jgi:selenocysteine-specific elongation factor